MKITSAKLVYFSPTQTTRRVVEQIAQGIRVSQVDSLDLTPPGSIARGLDEVKTDLVILGMPVYGGRLPAVAAHRLRQLNGRNIPAVIVVVYGNRAYEDALLELNDLALEIGFKPVAGGAFIGEHSYSTPAFPIAAGRPHEEDLKTAVDFGRRVGIKLRSIESLDALSPLQVPGIFPYKDYPGNVNKVSPLIVESMCQRCETCAAACPTGAIEIREAVTTDPDACILCCACVKVCPTGARVMDNLSVNHSRNWLSTHCSEPRVPEIYL